MTRLPPYPGTTGRRDWRGALDAVRRLMRDADDTRQVFRIMRALNVGNAPANYARLIATAEGGRMAYERVELAELLGDGDAIAGFAPGSVGAAYRDFLAATGYSADGLVAVSELDHADAWAAAHPYGWMGRRIRDLHDLWHVLTGYEADDPLGEAALVAFSFAQVGGLGWALIALAAALKSVAVTRSGLFARAVWEGYRHGRAAAWLVGEDPRALLHEPLATARARLGIRDPRAYHRARRELRDALQAFGGASRAAG
ncbi:Coq4 family protein [Sphingomonas sp. BK235]|uniref:Coq4 family protein n=1 Tax=Sphingomonas sp. BK235 TaxID=2512131 RepID=UPI0010447592|nr:Coq4 family protein [Sphingomonas sp. BK235]TCP36921.1 ubiquinone biosynthesis protein COQ4 [Sphingomonas sp. BK235]